ncbi:MAG: hypothetical protein ACRC2T_12180, partial [Thermoguttaceae bacterium]
MTQLLDAKTESIGTEPQSDCVDSFQMKAFEALLKSSVGNAAKQLFMLLWLMCGSEPGVIPRTSAEQLRKKFAKGNPYRWLLDLEKSGLIEVDRYAADSRDADLASPGDLRIWVFYPSVNGRRSKLELANKKRNLNQREFDFDTADQNQPKRSTGL